MTDRVEKGHGRGGRASSRPRNTSPPRAPSSCPSWARTIADKVMAYAKKNADADTDRKTFQAMEALVHNLNTMHSRAGAQTPFSSVNYGMDNLARGPHGH